jgi:hypothetical protein
MKTELEELIREARRKLRLASDIPLSAEERLEEHRTAEVDSMMKFLVDHIGFRLMFALKAQAVWTDKGAAAELTGNNQIFHLRKHGSQNEYGLFAVGKHGEREVAKLEGSDPLFESRILVAIGDTSTAAGDVVSLDLSNGHGRRR